ncbi:MAG: alpha/beta fold hydrolase [Phycisphaerales bacterium]
MILLLSLAALLLLLLLAGAIAWETTHPPRRTAAWAIAHGKPVDPGDLGLPFVEWTLDRPDGARMPVWEIAPARNGDDRGRTGRAANDATDGATHGAATDPRDARLCAIVLHGWGRSRIDSLGRVAALLRAADVAAPGAIDRVIVPELRGHGESGAEVSRLADGEDADLLELLRRIDAPSYVLAGHSMGGVVSILAAASDDPIAARVRGVIAWAPYTDVHVPMRNRLRAREAPARPFTDAALALLRIVGVRRRRTVPAAARLRCPLLVIQGEGDIVSPLDGAEMIASAAPRGTFVLLPGAHPDVHEVASDAHRAAVAAFLRDDCGARAADHSGPSIDVR